MWYEVSLVPAVVVRGGGFIYFLFIYIFH
jgi:hypothetical protein